MDTVHKLLSDTTQMSFALVLRIISISSIQSGLIMDDNNENHEIAENFHLQLYDYAKTCTK